MKQQPESEERRAMASELFLVLAGVVDGNEVRAELRRGGLDLQRVSLPDGGDRFIILEQRNGRVWDSFTFYAEASLGDIGWEPEGGSAARQERACRP